MSPELLAWFRARAVRQEGWRAESAATGVPYEDLQAAYFATPEGAEEGSIHALVEAAPPATEAQLAALRRIFRTARTRGAA